MAKYRHDQVFGASGTQKVGDVMPVDPQFGKLNCQVWVQPSEYHLLNMPRSDIVLSGRCH
jgi:hypothetical protein